MYILFIFIAVSIGVTMGIQPAISYSFGAKNYEMIRDIILRAAIHAIDFDLLTPPYQAVQQVTVFDMQTLSQSSKLKTGKRLGFKFQAETDLPDSEIDI